MPRSGRKDKDKEAGLVNKQGGRRQWMQSAEEIAVALDACQPGVPLWGVYTVSRTRDGVMLDRTSRVAVVSAVGGRGGVYMCFPNKRTRSNLISTKPHAARVGAYTTLDGEGRPVTCFATFVTSDQMAGLRKDDADATDAADIDTDIDTGS